MSATMWGQYNPGNPPEPGATYTLTLRATPADGGSFNISTTTSYAAGTSVRIVAYANSYFRFIAWEEDGVVISTNRQIDYLMKAQNTILTAHFEYDPNNPGEPAEPDIPVYSKLFLSCNPSDGGSFNVNSGNSYIVGSSVNLRAYNNNNFTFLNWTEDGEVISTTSSFNYVVKDHDSHLVANFSYNPGNPAEPEVARLMRKLTLVADPSEGGYFNISSGNTYQEGSTVNIRAYSNNFYSFDYWSDGADTVSTSYNISYVVPARDVTLVAHYKYNYNPGNPNEPNQDTQNHHTIYGMTENAVQGETVGYPIYLENTSPVSGIFIDAQFPEGFIVDTENVLLGDRTANHEVEILTVPEYTNCYRFRVTGEDYFSGNNGQILEIPVTVPDTATMGRNYPVKLTHGVILKNDSIIPQTAISVRSGYIYVEKLSEDGLYARFTFDKFQDHVQFKNLSSGKATSYLWDFGDGQQSTEKDPLHVYSNAGNYQVKLTVRGEVDTDAAEELVVIDDASTWRVNGQFYLADDELGARHFKTVEALFSALNRGSIDGNVVVNVLSGTTSDYDLTSSHLSLMQTLYNKFKNNGFTLTFNKRGSERNPVIRYGTSLQGNTAEDITKVLNTCDQFKYKGVDMRVCGIMVDAQALVDLSEQTVNSGAKTKPVNFSLISPDLTFSWSLKSIPENVTGYIESGSGSLPAMTIVNENDGNYTLEYEVNASTSGVSFYHFTYRIHVVPALVGLFNDLSPANGAVLDNTNVTLSWNQILNAKYDVYLWNASNERPTTPVAKGITELRYYSQNFLQHGNSYKWQVIAYNGFQEVVSDTMTFSINNLADLHIYHLDISEPAAGEKVRVKWNVQNDGTGPTGQVQWTDYVWIMQDVYSGTLPNPTVGANNNNTQLMTQVPNVKALDVGESYENSVEITLPERLYGDFYVLVSTDMYDVRNIQWSAVGGSVINPYNPTQEEGTGYRHLYATTSAYYNKVYEAGETTTMSDNFFYKKMHIDVPPLPDLQVPNINVEVIPVSTVNDDDIVKASEAHIPTPLTSAGLAHNTEMYSGKKLKVTATVQNKGAAAIENQSWRNVLYMSTSDNHETGILYTMDTKDIKDTTLAPGQSIDVEFEMRLPYEWHGDTYFHVYSDINNVVYELVNIENNWGTSDKYNVKLTPGADFEPYNLKAPNKASSTTNIDVKYDVKNIGPGDPYRGVWIDKVYLSKNKNGLDQDASCIAEIKREGYYDLVNVASVPAAPPVNAPAKAPARETVYIPPIIPAEDYDFVGDNYSVTQTIRPVSLPSGTYYLYVKVDATDNILEFNGEDNNVIRSGAIEYVEPDLTTELVSISADSLETGAIVAFTWKVKNVGNADLEDVKLTDAFYASVNQDGTNARIFATAENTIWLAAGAEKTLHANITIPKNDFLDGVRYVFMTTNYNHAITETHQSNNSSSIIRTWFRYLEEPVVNPARGSALRVSDIDVIGQLKPGASVKVKCNVLNYGDTPVGIDVSRDIYFKNITDNQRIDCEITKKEGTTVELLPNASVTLTTTVTVPNNMRGGEKDLYVHLDKENAIQSKDTQYNKTYKRVTIIGHVPNLEIVPLVVPDTIMSSVDTRLSWDLKNVGDWKSAAGRTSIYLSNDDKYDYNDVLLAKVDTDPIEAGAKITQSLNVNILDKYNGRRYIILAYDGNTYEESNICDDVPLPVMVGLSPCPDLQVTSIQTNEVIKAGETITIRYRVENNGGHATRQPYWADAFYLASSTILDKNDAVQLGSRTHNGILQIGGSYEAEVKYTVPATMQGNYMLYVVTDDADAIYEPEENNNALSSSVYLNGSSDRPADLKISNLSVPVTILAGNPITVKYDVTNIGEFEAKGTLRDVIYFSKDSIWDMDDPMVGVVSGEVEIAPGNKITRQATGSIINIVEGSYYVIVRTNSAHAIAESSDANNTVSSLSPSHLNFSTIYLGHSAQVNNAGYFKLNVPAGYEGKTIGVYLDHPEDATVGLYTALEQVPSTARYDLASFELQKSQQEVLIPDAQEGDYYILAQDLSNIINGEGYEFKLNAPQPTVMTLTAKEVQFGATSLSLTEGGTGGWVTTDVRGAMFDSIMDFRLVKEDYRIPAELTKYKGKTISRVTFNLNDAETGLYDVETELPDGTQARLPRGFHVIPGASVALGVRIESETEVHEGSFTPISIAYANGGNTDIEIVEILVVIDNGYLSTTIQGLERHESVIHIKPGGEPDPRGYVIIPPGTQDVVNGFLLQTVPRGMSSKIVVYLVK